MAGTWGNSHEGNLMGVFNSRPVEERKSNMSTKRFLSRPVSASLAAGLLCFLPTSNQHAQIIVGSTTATSFSGQAAAVTGFSGGGAVSVADTGALAASGGAIGSAALENSQARRDGVVKAVLR